jgi:hypothetical protein
MHSLIGHPKESSMQTTHQLNEDWIHEDVVQLWTDDAWEVTFTNKKVLYCVHFAWTMPTLAWHEVVLNVSVVYWAAQLLWTLSISEFMACLNSFVRGDVQNKVTYGLWSSGKIWELWSRPGTSQGHSQNLPSCIPTRASTGHIQSQENTIVWQKNLK